MNTLQIPVIDTSQEVEVTVLTSDQVYALQAMADSKPDPNEREYGEW